MQHQLILYGRSYCHLCDDLRDALLALQPEFSFRLELVDVDGDPALVARYDELVPVLVARLPDGTDRPLCHYFLDAGAVRSFLLNQA